MSISSDDLIKKIKSFGADLAGVADLSGMHELKTGISVAVAIPPSVIQSIHDGPNMNIMTHIIESTRF